jgi:hypothetical protein
MTQSPVSNFPGVLLMWCALLCPEFLLPLSVWLSSGWNGLLLHWRADLCAARQMGKKGCGVAA